MVRLADVGLFAGVSALAAAVVACAPGERDEISGPFETVAKAEQPISGGYIDDFDTAVVGIVHVYGNNGVGGCSGTLIAPNVVLTAQHCVAPTNTGGYVECGKTKFGATYSAGSFYITTATNMYQGVFEHHDYTKVREIHVPPTSPFLCGQDVAIMVLNTPIPAAQAEPRAPRVDVPFAADEIYYAVGYGEQGQNGKSGVRMRRDNLDTVCGGAQCAPGYISDREWLGETAVCSGDSGGPAFDLQNRVIGVASRGGPQCSSPIYGDVEGWGEWIKDITLQATANAGLPAPPWATGYPTDPAYNHPVGGACVAPHDCESNACLNGYCTRVCSAEAPCPEGYFCNGGGFCELVAPPQPDDPSNGGSGSTSGGSNDNDDDDNRGSFTAESSCAMSSAPQDPTNPIPWIVAPAALALLMRRRRAD